MGVYRRKDSPYWWLYHEATKTRERTWIRIGETISERRDSERLAQQLYGERARELAGRLHRLPFERPAIRFAVYADTYRTDVLAHHKGAVRECELLLQLVAFFGTDLLSLIDQDRVREYLKMRRQTVAVGTVNREVDLLKAMLRDAAPKYLPASPLVGMKRLKGPAARRRLLQPDEEARLLAVAKADSQDYALIVLAQDTLARMGDCLDLQRTDRQGDWIAIVDPKSGDPYEVPLSPRAAVALDAIDHDQPYYFEKFRQATKPRDWRGSVRQRLEYLCRLAKVPFGQKEGGITFHGATRKTGATRLLVKKGVTLAVVQQLGNWKRPDVLLKHYTEAQREDLLAAVSK